MYNVSLKVASRIEKFFSHKYLKVNLLIVDYNKTVFTAGMTRFAIEKLIPTLSQHGVDCVETFCSLTESDL